MPKYKILTSGRQAKHSIAGRNTQHLACKCKDKWILVWKKEKVYFPYWLKNLLKTLRLFYFYRQFFFQRFAEITFFDIAAMPFPCHGIFVVLGNLPRISQCLQDMPFPAMISLFVYVDSPCVLPLVNGDQFLSLMSCLHSARFVSSKRQALSPWFKPLPPSN